MLLSTLLLALRSIRRNLLRSFLTILGHRDRRQRGDHDGDARQRRDAGGADADLEPRHQPADGAPGPAPGARRRRRRADVQGGRCRGDPGADRRRRGGGARRPRRRHRGRPTAATGPPASPAAPTAGSTTGNWKLASGRMFADDEQTAGGAVCIIGETVRREIYGGTRGLGEQLRIKQFSCEVIGVLASKGQAAMGNDQDDTVVVPLHTLQRRVTGNQRISTLLVSMQDGSDSARLKASLRAAAARAPQARRRRRRQLQRARHAAARRDAVGHDQGDDDAARRRGRGEPAGRRHRHHEHHAGQRDRAHARDRPAPGHRRAGARGAAAVPDRGGGAGGAGRHRRHRHRHRRVHRAGRRDGRALPVRSGDQPAVVRVLGRHRRAVRLLSRRGARRRLDPIEALRHE